MQPEGQRHELPVSLACRIKWGKRPMTGEVRELRVLRGSLPRRAKALVLEWAAERQGELTEDWNLCSQLQPPKAIEPLR